MILTNDWNTYLKDEFNKKYYIDLINFLDNEYNTKTVYPPKKDLFNALNYTSYKDTSVVILGQDPYYRKDQSHGLSFSVNKNIRIPQSLRNIYKELNSDLGLYIPNNGYLKKWASQGVLLLNSSFSVLDNNPNSHKDIGWHIFTDKIIELLNDKNSPIVFILWGKNAQKCEKYITNDKHLVIKSAHPSPRSASRGFFNSRPFSKTNLFLKNNKIKEIDWQIDNI